MSYDAGKVVGTYQLNADDAEKTQQRLIANYLQIQKLANTPVPAVRTPAPAVSTPAAASTTKAALDQQRLADAQNKAALSAQKLATEQQRTAQSELGASRAAQQLARDTANVAAAEDKAAIAALRRQQAEDRAAKQQQNGGLGPALPRTFAGITSGGLNQVAGLAGGAFSAQALLNAAQESLALKETQNGLKAVAGSTETYNHVLATARQEQELFGGSLRENIEGLTGLTITSNQSGASLDKLIDLSQRLAVLDPSQGAAGARIALNEALSGDPTSLARRYEIPRAALAKLRDETTSASDKLQIIDQYLNKVGISSEAVAGRIDQDALAFRKAKAEIEEATLKLGDYLTKIAAIPARGVTDLLNTGGVAPGAVAAGDQVQGSLVKKSQDYAAYAAGVNQANDELQSSIGGVTGWYARLRLGLETLTPTQFAYAQSLIAAGTATDAAITKAKALAPVLETIAAAQERYRATTVLTQEGIDQFSAKLIDLASGSNEGRAAVESLNAAYQAGGITTGEYTRAVDVLIARRDASVQATRAEAAEQRRLLGVHQESIPVLSEEAQKKLDSAIASANLASEQTRIEESSKLAAVGLLGAGDQAEILAQKYGIATDQARFLIAQQQQLGQARADADQRTGERSGGQFSTAAQQTAVANNARAQAQATAKTQADIAAANRERILANGTSAQKIALLQKEAAEAARLQGPGSAAAIRAQTALDQARKTAAGATGGKGVSALDRTDIELAGDLQAQLDTVNTQLERGNLTQLQRNQLLIKQADLEDKITAAKEKQANASLNAQLDSIKDAQARLKETLEAAGLQRALAAGRLSAAQQQAAQLRLSEIALDQEKRRRDIVKEVRDAGGTPATPGAAVATPTPAVPTQPIPLATPTQPLPVIPVGLAPGAISQPLIVNLSLSIAKDGTPTVVSDTPGVVLNLLGQAAGANAFSGAH